MLEDLLHGVLPAASMRGPVDAVTPVVRCYGAKRNCAGAFRASGNGASGGVRGRRAGGRGVIYELNKVLRLWITPESL